jgi:NDP-sugar pyrophosphorylase family protein
MQAILLAGGRGTRLQPYTTVFPKPLVPVGDQPICEIIVRQLAAAGFDHVVFAVSHLAGLIEAYFGDGEKWGLRISYSLEDTPLGTAGPIGLVNDLESDFLVMNGDVLTDLDFRALVEEHRARRPIATITTARKDVPISLGVVTMDGDRRLVGYDEKPTLHYQVSTGIYVLDRRVRERLVPGQRTDLPDLMRDLVARGEHVQCHVHEGEWLDIGRPEDYEDALSRFAKDPGRFVPVRS